MTRKIQLPAASVDVPTVSVVLVNFRGATDTVIAVNALLDMDWPAAALDLIVVDNASGDDSVERLTVELPSSVRLIESDVNGGFTGGCNLGASRARGEYLAFLNNDARPDARWLVEAIGVLAADTTIGCVASKVLDWDGVNVDFVDAAMTWYGMGYKPGAGAFYAGDAEDARDVLFATGSAMITRPNLFEQLGGFDERFFMFYEDVDFGWRLNLMGHRVRYVPRSIVYHKHHATMNQFGAFREWYLLERNALMSLYKNLGQEMLDKVLAPAMILAVRRSLAAGNAETSALDLQRSAGGEDEEYLRISKRALTGPYALDAFVDQLPSLAESRRGLQQARVRSDAEILPLWRQAMEPAQPNLRYLAGYRSIVEAFDIDEDFPNRRHILVITADPLIAKMAGPAIRSFHIAEELSHEFEVRLISTASCDLTDSRFECLAASLTELRAQVTWSDIVIFQGFLLEQIPWLGETGKILVCDLYDPMHLEQLEQTRGDDPITRTRDVASTVDVLNEQLRRGDFFLCASEKQRDFWLGQLAGVGRLNPRTYDADPSLDSLLAVVPFGLSADPPRHSRSAIRGVVPGIGESDKLIVWAGGIYNWFDPLTLLRSVAQLATHHSDLRLFFFGTQHPNPLVPMMRMVTDTRLLADELGLTGKHVFFNEGWIDYSDRQNYLIEADLGVSTHFDHVETRFSFRTRILDYLWAGLPVVATEGDTFGDLISSRNLGVAVPERDVSALVIALERCLYDEEFAAQCRANVASVSPSYAWPTALRPLLQFCRVAHRAADVVGAPQIVQSKSAIILHDTRIGRNLQAARRHLAAEGPRVAMEMALRKARRIVVQRTVRTRGH